MGNYSTLQKKFSINNFISSFPNMLNEMFTAVYNIFISFYNEDTEKITCKSVEANTVNAVTLVTQNATVKDSTGKNVNIINKISEINNFSDRISALEEKVEEIDELKQRINELEHTLITYKAPATLAFTPDKIS